MAPRGLSEHLLEVLERTLELFEGDPPEHWLQAVRDLLAADSAKVERMRPHFDCDQTVYLDLAMDEACDWYQGALASLVTVTEGYLEEAESVRLSLAEADAAVVRAERLAAELRFPMLAAA